MFIQTSPKYLKKKKDTGSASLASPRSRICYPTPLQHGTLFIFVAQSYSDSFHSPLTHSPLRFILPIIAQNRTEEKRGCSCRKVKKSVIGFGGEKSEMGTLGRAIYTVGFWIRETGQAIDRLGSRFQGNYYFQEQR